MTTINISNQQLFNTIKSATASGILSSSHVSESELKEIENQISKNGLLDHEEKTFLDALRSGTTFTIKHGSESLSFNPKQVSFPDVQKNAYKHLKVGKIGYDQKNVLRNADSRLMEKDVKIQFGSTTVKLGPHMTYDSGNPRQFSSVEDAFKYAQKKQAEQYDSEDYAIVRLDNNKFGLRPMYSGGITGDDISKYSTLKKAKILSDTVNVAAVVSDNGQIKHIKTPTLLELHARLVNETDAAQIDSLQDLIKETESKEGKIDFENFSYSALDINNSDPTKKNSYAYLKKAMLWKPGNPAKVLTGSAGNVTITNTYHDMDAKFTLEYLGLSGNEGTAASWLTFAKSGSGSAGVQIGNVESALDALHELMDGDLMTSKDASALATIAYVASQEGMPTQFTLLAEKLGNDITSVAKLGSLIKDATDTMMRLRDGLVEGNTEIYQNAIPLYDQFMKGEASGGKGLEYIDKMLNDPGGMFTDNAVVTQWTKHVKEASGRPINAQETALAKKIAQQNRGLITKAFTGFKKAHDLYQKAQNTSNPAEKKKILAERDQVISQANIDFVTFEQLFAQPIYNKIHDLTGAVTGTVRLFDANLPQGQELLKNLGPDARYKGVIDVAGTLTGMSSNSGNWGDFEDRMGFVQIPISKISQSPNARQLTIPIFDPATKSMTSKTAYYAPDPKLTSTTDQTLRTRGTISDYFLGTPPGEDAENLIFAPPPIARKIFTYKP